MLGFGHSFTSSRSGIDFVIKVMITPLLVWNILNRIQKHSTWAKCGQYHIEKYK